MRCNACPYKEAAIPPPPKPFPCDQTDEARDPRENRDESIPVVVSIIIPIVMVPMMVPVPPLPLIFIRMAIVAVSVLAIVIGPVLLVSRISVHTEPLICFGLAGCESKQTERCQSQEEISFHMILLLFRRKGITFHAGLTRGSGCSLTILERTEFHRIAPTGSHWRSIVFQNR